MKIKRNFMGTEVSIEITPEELKAAYEEQKTLNEQKRFHVTLREVMTYDFYTNALTADGAIEKAIDDYNYNNLEPTEWHLDGYEAEEVEKDDA